jgi:ribose transport system permease protein
MTTATTDPDTTQTPTSDQPTHDHSSAAGIALDLTERFGLALLTIGVIVFFAVLPATRDIYLTSADIQTTIGNQTVLAIAAIAAIPPLVGGRYDLSIGAVLGLSAVVSATLMSKAGWPLVPAALMGILSGTALGFINGLLTSRLRIDSLISTLAVATIIGGVVSRITNGSTISANVSQGLIDFGSSTWLGVPKPVFVLIIVAIAIAYLQQHTPFGRYLQSVGTNEDAARLVGLKTDRLVLLSFVLAGTISGIAGVILVARAGAAAPNAGPLYSLPAFAAAFLGATAVRPGRFNVGGTLVAILFLAAITTGLNLAGAQNYVTDVVNGAALLVGVGLTAQLARRRSGT